MKQWLLISRIGGALLRLRSYFSLRRIPFHNPEKSAAVASGILAEKLLIELCQGKSTFLDIGAHLGSVFSQVHRSFPDMRIYAIEADPEKARALRDKFAYCNLIEKAVDQEARTAIFYIDSNSSGYNSIVESRGTSREIEVQVDTLDNLFPTEVFEVIKIDIEGAELGALRGGASLLRRSRPLILFESAGLGVNMLGYSADALWGFLEQHGFSIFLPERLAHDAPSMSKEVFLDAHYYPTRGVNFFAVPIENRTEIRDRARSALGIVAKH